MKRELNDKNEIDDKNIKNIFRILIICVFIVVVPRVIYVRKWFFFKKISWSEIQLTPLKMKQKEKERHSAEGMDIVYTI